MSWRGLGKFIRINLGKTPATALVLNVGAGGRTAKLIESIRQQCGFNILSIDIDPARQPDIVADVITFSSAIQYDVIIMIEVLEHVRRPRAAIKNVYNLLKPGGRLILSTPFLFPLHDRPMDFFRYTRYGLADLCADFESIDIRERDGWAETLCVLVARLLKERSMSARLVGPLAVLVAALFYPFAILLTRCIKSDAYTIGYTLVATKSFALITPQNSQ